MLNMDYVLLSLEPSVHLLEHPRSSLPHSHLSYCYTPHLTDYPNILFTDLPVSYQPQFDDHYHQSMP